MSSFTPPTTQDFVSQATGKEEVQPVLSDTAVKNISAFFTYLRTVIRRLESEGYKIKDGQIIPPEGDDENI